MDFTILGKHVFDNGLSDDHACCLVGHTGKMACICRLAGRNSLAHWNSLAGRSGLARSGCRNLACRSYKTFQNIVFASLALWSNGYGKIPMIKRFEVLFSF